MFVLGPFLPVQTSLWPFLISLSLLSMMLNIVLFMSSKFNNFLVINFSLVVLISFLWWKDVQQESLIGYHTHKLESSLRVGFLFFILSEIFFFLAFFWAFFDASLSPTVEVAMQWPPKGIVPLSAFEVPLLNTIILLTSGLTVTWAHHSLMSNYFTKSVVSLFLTVVLGMYFLVLQWMEYSEAQFSLSDSVYGSTFFMTTGFHGMHVFIGTSFLLYILVSLVKGILVYNHHSSFEFAAWYWHFVDLVWLFVFIMIYIWGSSSIS